MFSATWYHDLTIKSIKFKGVYCPSWLRLVCYVFLFLLLLFVFSILFFIFTNFIPLLKYYCNMNLNCLKCFAMLFKIYFFEMIKKIIFTTHWLFAFKTSHIKSFADDVNEQFTCFFRNNHMLANFLMFLIFILFVWIFAVM